jgi:hypothetical protein
MTSSKIHGMKYIKFTILPFAIPTEFHTYKSQFDVCLGDALEQALKGQSLCKNVPITMCVALLKSLMLQLNVI